MKCKIGDRFKYTNPNNTYNIWEYIGDGTFLIVYSPFSSLIGTEWKDVNVNEVYEFIGNFAKQSNFEELYNLLNS